MSTSERMPLREDEHGTLRIGATRVTLEVVISSFLNGSTPEDIAQQFPTLDLADIYYVLGYFLRHREEINGYLQQQDLAAEQVRRQIAANSDQTGIRERLLARKAQQQSA